LTPKPSLGSSDVLASTSSRPVFGLGSRHSGGLNSTSSPPALASTTFASPTKASLSSSDSLVSDSARAIKSAELTWPSIDRVRSHRSHSPPPLPGRKDTTIASTSNVSSGGSGGLPSTSLVLLLGARPPTSPLVPEAAAPDTLLPASANGLPPGSPLALEDTWSAPSSTTNLEQSGSLALTLAPTSASPLDVDSGEPSSTTAEPDTFRLFDLPQELQDAIFDLAYTEPGYINIYKRNWVARDKYTRKTTSKLEVGFPNHKVNEWMVSKKYFKAAAKAWMDAQTCPEFVYDLAQKPHRSRFPTITYNLGDGGLFLESARTLVVNLANPICWHDFQQIWRCRKLRDLVCTVDEDFFVETRRGYAWEVEFTEDEIMASLDCAKFDLPRGVEGSFASSQGP
jgi:hypothetical protein